MLANRMINKGFAGLLVGTILVEWRCAPNGAIDRPVRAGDGKRAFYDL